MPLDLKNSYEDAKTKIQAYKTVIESQENQKEIIKQNLGSSFESSKSEALNQLNDIKSQGQRLQEEIKNQYDELIDLFKMSMPDMTSIKNKFNDPNSIDTKYDSVDFLLKQVLNSVQNTKSRMSEVITEEVMKTAGCSEEQTFLGNDAQGVKNNKIYIRVNQIDIGKKLTKNPEDNVDKLLYEKENRINGISPYPMDKELFTRIQNQGVYFSDEFGQEYIGESGSEIFDIRYVTSYEDNGTTYTGDFFEVTLTNRIAGNSISDFLRDYYKSIDIINFDNFGVKIMNNLTNFIDISAGLSRNEKEEQSKFEKIIQRILGLCFDGNEEIDVSGNAKLSVLDDLDDSFFEMSSVDLRNIEYEVGNYSLGVTEFKDCGNIKFPVNVASITQSMENVRKVGENEKVDKFIEEIEKLTQSDEWRLLLPNQLNLNVAFKGNVLKIIPKMASLTILTPKVLLGLMIVLKSVGSNIMDGVEDFRTFIDNMKQFLVEIVSKIGSIFIEELFKLLKKNIRRLVEILLMDILKEAKDARVKMISSIIFILIQLASAAIDWRQCKSVVDEILNLLNLAVTSTGLGNGLPSFALAASGLLGGYSPTRAFSNVTEKLQSLGLPTGALPDGSPNVALPSIFEQIKGMNDEQLANGKTEVFLPPLAVAAFGGGTTFPGKGIGKTY